MAYSSTASSSNPNANKVCDVCLQKPADKDTIPLAVKRCTVCSQNLCNGCLQYHAAFSATSEHTLQGLDSRSSFIVCYHSNKSWFCQCHKDFCCDDCKGATHDNCDRVLSSEEILRKQETMMKQNQKLLQKLVEMKYKIEEEGKTTQKKEKDWMERLNTELTKMNQAKEELEDQIQLKVDYVKSHMKKNREIVDKKINDLQNGINNIERDKLAMESQPMDETKRLQLINKMEENLTKTRNLLSSDTNECHIAFLKANCAFEAKHYYNEIMVKFKDTIESINKIYEEIQKHIFPSNKTDANESDAEDTIPKTVDDDDTFVNIRLSKPLKKATTIGRPSSDNNTDKTKPKSSDDDRKRCWSENDLSEETYRKEPIQRQTASKTDLAIYQETLKVKQPVKEIEIQSRCQMNVKIESDETTCGITGISTLKSGNYFIADFQNSKLKIFAPCGKYLSHLDCESKPRDIAKMSKNEYLVTFPMAEIVRIVTVEEDTEGQTRSIEFQKDIPTHARCCGVAYHNGRIYVATQLPHQILIMFPDGKNDRVIVGDNMFERATYIAVEPTTSIVFISDPNKMFVLAVNDNMKKKFEYEVQQPHAIACAGDGRIFVSDWFWERETIHLVDKDGVKIGYVHLPNCQCPQKLMYIKEENTLLVSNWMDNQLMTVRLKPF